MKIAVASTRPGPEGRVPDTFSQTPWLLIYNAETGELLHRAPRGEEGDLGLAREILKWDCEGVLCGPIEREPFLVIADEGCVTRYYAVGLNVEKALEALQGRSLDFIRDHIGGDHRPPQGSGPACGGHHHQH